MKITIPIPGAKNAEGDKQYGVEFDSDNIKKTNLGIGISESFQEGMALIREPDGTSTLTLHFENPEHRPMWVIVEEGPDGRIIDSRPTNSDD